MHLIVYSVLSKGKRWHQINTKPELFLHLHLEAKMKKTRKFDIFRRTPQCKLYESLSAVEDQLDFPLKIEILL